MHKILQFARAHSRILFLSMSFLLLILFVVLARGEGIFGTTLPWYAVEPWEAEVCAKWGGHATASQSFVELGITPAGDMTMTVQGKKTKVQQGQYLYEISYYLESFGALTTYHLSLVNPVTQEKKTLTEGTLAPGSAVTDYVSDYLNEKYTFIQLTHDRGVITAPIIEVK